MTQTIPADADITISLFFAISGPFLGLADVVCTTASVGITTADIVVRTKGLNDFGLQNVSAHETGHGLGLIHADNKKDLMHGRFERKEQGKKLVCPSNLDVNGLTSTTSPVQVADLVVPATC